jgi:preprotein translocase subunit SecD
VAGVTLALVALGVVLYQAWSRGTPVEAAVRIEVRLAETEAAGALRAARIAGSDRVVYLHPETVVSNGDVADSRAVPSDDGLRFSVLVELHPPAAERMRRATSAHVGRPLAILIDGEVAVAPIVRSPIGETAVITGNYSKAEAQRIADGLTLR